MKRSERTHNRWYWAKVFYEGEERTLRTFRRLVKVEKIAGRVARIDPKARLIHIMTNNLEGDVVLAQIQGRSK